MVHRLIMGLDRAGNLKNSQGNLKGKGLKMWDGCQVLAQRLLVCAFQGIQNTVCRAFVHHCPQLWW